MSSVSQVAALAVAALAGVLGGVGSPFVLASIRQPPAPPSAVDGAPTLRELAAGRRLTVGVALAGVACGVLVAERLGWSPDLLPWLVLVAAGPLLGYVDARTHLLPTAIIAPAYGCVLLLLVVAALADGSVWSVVGAALGWALMGGFYLVLWYVAPAGVGYGDVRLAGLLALCLGALGWAELVAGLFLGFVFGGLVSLALLVAGRAGRKTQLPFGPAMLFGALAALLVGPQLAGWFVVG